ncbi:MAG: glyoxalase/bleomycin resistance/extradiol dioxygenase family protein [Proteobacteria bacterium]|nr:MAG: glyoxalase/bleomycin resistance/extradiol dioxygenase family protein [Pseudomonadota bacterium]
MATMIFVNLPVKDLAASRKFYSALGYTFNEQFSDESGACLVISNEIYAMLLTYPKFKGFAPNEIADAKKTTQVLNCLSCNSKDEVNAIVAKALKAGGTRYSPPQDHGFMFADSFQDLDGHVWEYMWMDMTAVPT